jgi:hypothetical protein
MNSESRLLEEIILHLWIHMWADTYTIAPFSTLGSSFTRIATQIRWHTYCWLSLRKTRETLFAQSKSDWRNKTWVPS